MGCTNGHEPEIPDAALGAPPPTASQSLEVKKRSSHQEKLLDKYTLGKSIGQGAFGVVYSCKLIATGEEYAVKMIDPVETPLVEITREVEMLRLLANPCVVAMSDVFYEKIFVCLVMEIYKGGDMIEGQQLHWKNKGQIPIPVVQNTSKMMFQAVDWLHQNSIVHRDLKGDNYLMSIKHIEDMKCRVYMSDFGTVVALNPGERLNQKCGTKTYWAPELYRLDYGLSVDIWAVGIVMFGMVTGRFPFKGAEDVKKKEVRVPSRATRDGSAFITGALKKGEEERLTAKQCLEHVFLGSIKSAAEIVAEVGQEEQEEVKGEFKEQGANAGVKKRRQHLVSALEEVQNRSQMAGTQPMKLMNDFEVEDKRAERTTKFEWWSPDRVEQAGFLHTPGSAQTEDKGNALTEDVISKMMEEHHISTANFGQGQAKQLSEFMAEVQAGESRLMLDATRHKNLVRVIDVVLLRIVHGTGAQKRYLIKLSEKFPDGRIRDRLNNLPGTKKRPHENGRQVVERLIEERLKMADCNVVFDFVNKESFEDDEESPSYPGVRTVYRKEIYEGHVVTKDVEILKKLGLEGEENRGQYVAEGTDQYTRNFCWASEGACFAKGIKFQAPKHGAEISPLVPTPVGYSEEELQAFLEANHVDLSAFAETGPGSLANLAEELQMGDAALVRQPDGRILRVVEVVILTITKKNGDMLVQAWQTTDKGAKKTERLPGVTRRQDENLFWAAHRMMADLTRINENMVKMDPETVVLIEEEKPSEVYTNLPTLYRRRIIPATLVEE